MRQKLRFVSTTEGVEGKKKNKFHAATHFLFFLPTLDVQSLYVYSGNFLYYLECRKAVTQM